MQIISKPFRNIPLHPLRNISLTAEQNQQAAKLWSHSSDHLPTYARVNECRFGTHNVLNNDFIHHIEKIPFWNESDLVRLSKMPSETYNQASQREEDLVNGLQKRLLEKRSVDVLSLQECSDRMCDLLREVLEPKVAVIVGNGNRNNHVVTLVNKDAYEIEEAKISPIFKRNIPKLGGLVWDEWRPAVDVKLTSKKSSFGFPEKKRFVNLHISSAGETEEYKLQRLKEVRSYLDAFPFKAPSIVCGDFNANAELTDAVFNSVYKSLRSHHTQVECIPKDDPKIVAIDDIRVHVHPKTEHMFERSSIPLEIADPDAHRTFQEALAPFIRQD